MSGTSMNEATQVLLAVCEARQRWKKELTGEAVRKWVAQGADLKATAAYGRTALHLAVRGPSTRSEPLPDVDVVRALIDAGSDVNARDTYAQTPLICAIHSEETPESVARALDIIRMLRAAGARIPSDVKNGHGGAFRITSAAEALAREVLDAGAAIDGRDVHGKTPLHSAVGFGLPANVKLLLERGAEVNAVDNLGLTPLGLALRTRVLPWVQHNQRTSGFNAVIALLEAAGGKPSVSFPRSEDVFAPFPIDPAALAQALGDEKLGLSHPAASAQEVTTVLYSYGAPSESLGKLKALRDALSAEPPRKVQLPGPLTLDSAFFHHGDLEVRGDLTIHCPFAVTGDVIVHGVITDSSSNSLVNILGTLKCHGLFTDREFNVAGDIEARDVVLGYYNDHALAAHTIKARAVIQDDHGMLARIRAEHHLDLTNYEGEEPLHEKLRAIFVDSVLKPDEDADEEDVVRLDNHTLFAHIRQGLPVFRK
ncbi:hypothetical protein WA016_04364 [Myxococcus stipitatus]